jgi:hypothetical protein
MRWTARRIALGSAVLAGGILVTLAIVERGHVRAWWLQATREMAEIKPVQGWNGLTWLEMEMQKSRPLRGFGPREVDASPSMLCQFIASHSGVPVMHAGVTGERKQLSREEAWALTADLASERLRREGYLGLRAALPAARLDHRRAGVTIRSCPGTPRSACRSACGSPPPDAPVRYPA